MIRRLCFDTESNYVKPKTSGAGELDYHRDWIKNFTRNRKIRWDCAVVYDEAADEYKEFGNHEADELVVFLATADEFISHSGQRHDLLILEHILGIEYVEPLQKIVMRIFLIYATGRTSMSLPNCMCLNVFRSLVEVTVRD